MARKKPTPSAELIEKELRVVELRRAGHTWEEIANRTGYANPSAAFNAFQQAIRRVLREPVEEALELELQRLDKFLNSLWPAIEAGDPAAIDRGLKIMDRRAKYLGMDAPTKQQVEVTTYEGGTDIDREVNRLAQLLATGSRVPNSLDTPTGTTQSD